MKLKTKSESKPKPKRTTFTPWPLVKQLAKDVPGFKNESPEVQAALATMVSVSYTHLTLPTSDLV